MRECGKFSQLASPLVDYTVVAVEGSDACKFLQGQLTCDVVKLAENSSTLAVHCDPKGKVTSLFRLVKFNATQFWLIIHHSFLPSAIDFLKKYAVFSKVDFIPLEQKKIYAFSPAVFAQQVISVSEVEYSAGAVVMLDQQQVAVNVAQANPYWLLITENELTVTGSQNQWQLLAIQNGEPLLTATNQAEFIPQAINLQCVESAISFSKGCYMGQETVARAKYRGANKRAMFTLVSEQDPHHSLPALGSEVEMKLENGWRKTGKIISAIQLEQRIWLQVVLNKDVENESKFRLPVQAETQNETGFILAPLPYLITE